MFGAGDAGWDGRVGGGREEGRGWAGGEAHTEPVEEECTAGGGGRRCGDGLPVPEEEPTVKSGMSKMMQKKSRVGNTAYPRAAAYPCNTTTASLESLFAGVLISSVLI